MSEFDTAIIGGIVIDGTGAPRYRADVGIKSGRVAQIGSIARDAADQVLDADGLIVAPGFIDLHTHYDAQLFWDPYCTMSGWHGVTSVVIGNCGFGFAPVPAEHRERAMRSMTRVEAIPFDSMAAGMPWDWETFPEFLDSLERTPKGLNVLPYVPAGPLLAWVLGYERAKAGVLPTDVEHREMQRLLHEAMDAGACGWSAQRLVPEGPASTQRDFDGTPMITDVMHDATCHVLAEVLRDRNEGFIQMTMISGDPKRDAECYESMARISGRPVLYNVVQAFDDRPEIHRGALRWLRTCRERGLRVYGQGLTTDAGYTFTFEDWNLFDDAEPWREATLGTVDERLAKLADPARRPALRAERPRTATESIEKITVLGPRTPATERFREWTIAEVAAEMGVDPVDALLDIAVADGLKTLFFVRNNNNSIEYLREIVDDPYVTFGVSDGGAHTKFLTAGRYPTETIIKVVREHAMCSLEHVHWRLSAFPAWCAGFADRGVISIGSPADLVVYDLDRLEVSPTTTVTDLPGGEWRRIQRATGYRWTLVNGQVTFEDGESTGATPGVLLRHGHA